MPYKYIGQTNSFKGKTLWEILGNLKNFGVGRTIIRSTFERYPEPSYIKVLKVETLVNPEKPTHDNCRKIRVLVEKTFRGNTCPKPVTIESTSYKADYQLIPKNQEAALLAKSDCYVSGKVFAKTMDFPPLLKELLVRNAQSKGEGFDNELTVFYNRTSSKQKYQIAQDKQSANTKVALGLGTPVSPRLYQDVQ